MYEDKAARAAVLVEPVEHLI
ncbi:hypothetical protein AZE42_10999 [Rhizopogon vesiculosus]|uniref:Uncharacterized protein n=1 Tax=Rhizopogon vesiculosus TaxID=180088 RepID=A0A1J8QNV1_9AGAM|nr:hypothetical protein AZE42_10999 [Rhizopogon vesiculosus]